MDLSTDWKFVNGHAIDPLIWVPIEGLYLLWTRFLWCGQYLLAFHSNFFLHIIGDTLQAIASSSTDFSRPPPAVVPIANFATPPPSVYAGAYTAPAPTLMPSNGQWDQLVEGFLRRTTARRISRSRSRSSSSSFSRSRFGLFSFYTASAYRCSLKWDNEEIISAE